MLFTCFSLKYNNLLLIVLIVIFLFSFVRPKEVFDFAENVPDRARVLLRYAQERPRRIPGVIFINILPAALVANRFSLIVLGLFQQHIMSSFYAYRSQKRKEIESSHQSFLRFWDLRR